MDRRSNYVRPAPGVEDSWSIASILQLKLERAREILRAPHLTPQLKRALLSADWNMAVKKRLLRAREFSLQLRCDVDEPTVRVHFGAKTLTIDRSTFFDIFLGEIYRTDYTHAAVVDIGGHKGYFGAYALLHGARCVVSYEPESQNFSFLKKTADSFRERGFDWRLRNVAVGASDGVMPLHVSRESWAHSLIDLPSEGRRSQVTTQEVAVVAIQHVLADAAALADAKLVAKIDVEGAECSLVLQAPLELWRRVDELFLEIHPYAPCSGSVIAARLARAGLEPVTAVPEDQMAVVRFTRR